MLCYNAFKILSHNLDNGKIFWKNMLGTKSFDWWFDGHLAFNGPLFALISCSLHKSTQLHNIAAINQTTWCNAQRCGLIRSCLVIIHSPFLCFDQGVYKGAPDSFQNSYFCQKWGFWAGHFHEQNKDIFLDSVSTL